MLRTSGNHIWPDYRPSIVRAGRWCFDEWKQDVRYALRSIAGAKRFAAIVIATLALGIGANTAVFSVLNAVVLQPLPYDQPERLVRVYLDLSYNGGFWPAPALVALREQSRSVDLGFLYTYAPEGADLTDLAQPERVQVLRVSADYLACCGPGPCSAAYSSAVRNVGTPGLLS